MIEGRFQIPEPKSDWFLSRVSILTRDIDIANLSVRRTVPVLYENGGRTDGRMDRHICYINIARQYGK